MSYIAKSTEENRAHKTFQACSNVMYIQNTNQNVLRNEYVHIKNIKQSAEKHSKYTLRILI